MKKIILSIFLAITFLIAGHPANAQTNPHRSANQFNHYLTVMGQEFWDWGNPNGPFDTLGSTYDYLNLYKFDTMLGLNCERRQLYDKPSGGANPDRVKAGLAATTFSYLWYCPAGGLGTILNDAKAIRFEAERHNPGNDTAQFDGFLWNSNSGSSRLIGRNAHDADASSPVYARHSPLYGSDTSINCLVLDSIGHPGYFADSLWNLGFWSTQCNYPEPHWRRTDDFGHRQVGLRFRVRIDDTSYHSHPGDTVFTVHLVLRDTGQTRFDTTFLFMANDSSFLHSPDHFDTVTCRFVYPWGVDTSYVSLYWQGTHPITADWMEALTTRLDTAPYPWYYNMNIYLGTESPDLQHYNDRLSYETLTANGDAALKQGIDTIIQRYKGFFPLVETREEPCLASLTTIKRAIKLLRDRSNDSMEFITSMHDSIDQNITTDPFHTPPLYQAPGFYGSGYPNGWRYFLEGVRLGWLDSNFYADPKFFWTGLGVHSYTMPMPCRTIQQGDGLYQWEALYANTGFSSTSYGWTPSHWRPDQPGLFYDRDRYLTAVQAKEKSSLNTMRMAKRVCERNSAIGQKFFAAMEFDTPLGGDTVLRKVRGGGTRVPTAAEMRWGANLATSCGASGFYWWGYGSTAGVAGMTGDVTSNWRWVKTAYNDSAQWFDAHEEHFNAVKQINPTIRTYGDVLLHSNYIGDWTALEALSLSTAPFVGNSIHSVDDSDRTDVLSTLPDTIRSHYFPDSIKANLTVVYDTIRDSSAQNRTFVHISEWVDTSAGKSDTLLYITNMRTDDSYVIDTTTNPGVRDSVFGTFDRRYITMQMKAPHLVTDVADTANLMMMGKVRTPYVGAGDSLVVWLLPGDGVLVRLALKKSQPAPQSLSSETLDVTVHPNPVRGTVKICVADLPQGIPAMVDVVNEMGVAVAKLYDATPDAELGLCLSLDCSNLPSGTYYADLQTEGAHKAVQFSVQH